MAEIREVRESRVGATVAYNGSSNVTRTFLVIVDDRADDPRAVLALNYPISSADPWDASVFVSGYTIAEKMGHTAYKVTVLYEPINVVAPTQIQGWKMRFSTAGGSFRMYDTLPITSSDIGKSTDKDRLLPVGGDSVTPFVEVNRYGQIPINGALKNGVKSIGPLVYTAFSPGPESPPHGSHYIELPTGRLELVQTQGRRVIGYDAESNDITMIAERDTGRVPTNVGAWLAAFKGRVNDRTFVGATAGHIKVVDIQIDQLNGTISGYQLTEGIYYHVTIIFRWSATTFTPYELTHTYKDEFGNEYPIADITTDLIVSELFKVAHSANLYALTGLFA